MLLGKEVRKHTHVQQTHRVNVPLQSKGWSWEAKNSFSLKVFKSLKSFFSHSLMCEVVDCAWKVGKVERV